MRVRRFVLVVAAALGVAVLSTISASAGGGWSIPERSAYVPAEVRSSREPSGRAQRGRRSQAAPTSRTSFRPTVGSRATGCRSQRSRSARS
jgi:hypothetical protein